MNADGVYFMSFFIRKTRETELGVTQYASVSLRPPKQEQFQDNRILFGMSSENYIIMTHNDQQVMSAPQLSTGETYFYVAKIVAARSDPDQVLLRVYTPLKQLAFRSPSVGTAYPGR